MRDRDDVTAAELIRQAVHGPTDASANLSKAFAAWRTLLRGCIPVACRHRGPAGGKVGAVETLPLAEMLFCELRNREKGRCSLVLIEVSAAPERLGGVAGAAEMAADPD